MIYYTSEALDAVGECKDELEEMIETKASALARDQGPASSPENQNEVKQAFQSILEGAQE